MSPATSLIVGDGTLVLEYLAAEFGQPRHASFIAVDFKPLGGSAFVPHGRGHTGSTIILPFRANRIYGAQVSPGGAIKHRYNWFAERWTSHLADLNEFTVEVFPGRIRIAVQISAFRDRLDGASGTSTVQGPFRVAAWSKAMDVNDGWGALLPDATLRVRGGVGDQYINRYFDVDIAQKTARIATRHDRSSERVRIYQLLPRLFSNTNETRIRGGTLAQNGVGKFQEISSVALGAIKAMGCTHVWMAGVLRQASSTDYGSIGLPAAPPALLKGRAGSPYAIVDYFDVCPDYAVNPLQRIPEFCALLDRAHDAGLSVLIDFVPNHVARNYRSAIRPDLDFGISDDRGRFFHPDNNFFWLPPGDEPLRLPTDQGWVIFEPEREYGRVTGNNTLKWAPSRDDWYETVKLNYGFDFTTGKRAYPHAEEPDHRIPDTWKKMDAVLAYWQALGVDGFRCDMAHMVPPEFWGWAIDQARGREGNVFFLAEAYPNDPMKVGNGDAMLELLGAGFDAVYDDPSYKVLKGVYEAGKWANDLDAALAAPDREFLFTHSMRYAENHDEVRLAGRGHWGGVGLQAGPVVTAILAGVGRGPVLLYSGQEVGEPADGAEGFGGDDARTTIFDYWSMPELVRWVNEHRYDGGRLFPAQRRLRDHYARLLHVISGPAFRDGPFYGLNYANRDNPRFGRLPDESASGHWLYAFLRGDAACGQRFLCVANLHPTEILHDVHIHLPDSALKFIGLASDSASLLVDWLGGDDHEFEIEALREGVTLSQVPALTARFFELRTGSQ